jgi:hypothetical protein
MASLKSPKCPTHLAWPVSLCVAMEDNKGGCKKEKRYDAAEVREKATPVSDQRRLGVGWPSPGGLCAHPRNSMLG